MFSPFAPDPLDLYVYRISIWRPFVLWCLCGLGIVGSTFSPAAESSAGSQDYASLLQIGDALRDQHKLPEALKAYSDVREVAELLVEQEPGNAQRQRDLRVALIRHGDVLGALAWGGHLPHAINLYRQGLAIAERLLKPLPSDFLFATYGRMGDEFKFCGQLAEALDAYRTCLAIFERLPKEDQEIPYWQQNRGAYSVRFGAVLQAQGHPEEALAAYREALSIAERLSKRVPEDARVQRDVVYYNKMVRSLAQKEKE